MTNNGRLVGSGLPLRGITTILNMGLAIPKINPLHLPGRRQMLKAAYKVLRPNVRRDTWIRDGRRCRVCTKMVQLHTDDPFQLANIHERTGGSKRAEEAIDITLRSTITLCGACHGHVELNKLVLTCEHEDEGFNGLVLVSGTLPNRRKPLAEPIRSLPTLTPQEARTP